MFSWDDPKHIANLVVGLTLTALGSIHLLSKFGVIGFTLPGFINNVVGTIAVYAIAAIGLWLLIDGFMEDGHWRMTTIIVALAVIAIGVIPVLNTFGVIGFTIPFLSLTLYYVIFLLEGILLILAAFLTF